MHSLTILAEDTTSIVDRPKPLRVFGIDLGTTNSTIAEATFDPAGAPNFRVECISVKQPTEQGNYTHLLLPSVVALNRGEVIVGEGAKRLRAGTNDFQPRQYENLFYDCKNEIGIQKTYHRAPIGFRSAAEIGGKVLDYLYRAALSYDSTPPSRVVVTVPASFQLPQREDTMKAAHLAGLDVSSGGLLDEPIAAFIDYVARNGNQFRNEIGKRNWVVFDFGGGTCDVAIFSIEFRPSNGRPHISPLAVSRYHRLGGSDIDAAIVYDILIPELLRQNEIDQFELSWDIKKRFIEPTLRNIAEALKITLCNEISRHIAFNRYEQDQKSIFVQLPHTVKIDLDGRILILRSPRLNAVEYEKILEPFIDRYVTLHRETEYRTTCSMFAPLSDGLYRARLDGSQIDYCLAVGGSSLIPQVKRALGEFFSKAKILYHESVDDTQVSVARGAAYHALSLALFNKGLVQPVCFDAISIKTRNGFFELVPSGTALPFPSSGDFNACHELVVPETTFSKPLDLRIEIIAGELTQQRIVENKVMQITTPVNQGDPLLIEYRMDENQVLYMRIRLQNLPDQVFELTLENPLTNVVNPNPLRTEIDRLEEDMRTGKYASYDLPDLFVELAEKYNQLGQREKAMTYLQQGLKGKGTPDPYILNLMGITAGQLGDRDGEIRLYREAAKVSNNGIPQFNAALALEKRGSLKEAIESVDQAIEQDAEPAYFVLRAELADKSANIVDREKYLEKAKKLFGPINTMTEWELVWYMRAMRMGNDTEHIKLAELEFTKRKSKRSIEVDPIGELPGIRSSIVKR